MRPVTQTKFGQGTGNCFSACVASIFELDLQYVPDFCLAYDIDTWWSEFSNWCARFGFRPLGLPWSSEMEKYVRETMPDVYFMGLGRTMSGDHAVVMRGAEPVWDPIGSAECALLIQIAIFFVHTMQLKEGTT